MKNVNDQIKIIMKGALEIINKEDLVRKLETSIKENRPLIVKLGLDPSAPDIHLGHAVVLRKIRQMQDLGHRAVIIIGDFTGMIGDPTGRSKTRKQLTREEVVKNALTYQEQIFKILDKDKTELRFNSQWLSKMTFADVINLASKTTVARILERDDFEKRYKNNESIGLHEFFYPLMQAYDSVEVKADIEIGGTDQRFNILFGRNLQKDYGQECQTALFMPLLEGTDGVEKMSKSLGNYIGINEDAATIFQKVMSIPDDLIIKYYELATDVHPDDINKIKECLGDGSTNPRDVKMSLAKEITTLYHDANAAMQAEQRFINIYQKNIVPDDVPIFYINDRCYNIDRKIDLVKIIAISGMAVSNSEARRLITQGAVKMNGEKINDLYVDNLTPNSILQIGKSKFLKVLKDE